MLSHYEGLVVLKAAVLAGCFVTACQVAGHWEPAAEYSLEIVNDSADGVRMNVGMRGHKFLDMLIDPREPFTNGIVALEGGERRRVEMSTGIGAEDSQEDSYLVRDFREIHFFDPGKSVPYRSYEYERIGCVGGCGSDHTLFLHVRSDGVEERLFLESPDRPFYLERDKEDGDLARIVITFVPSADEGSGNGVEPVEARR